MNSTRRQFLQSSLSFAACALTLAGCAEDSGGGPQGDGGTPTEVLITISANHGHVLVVSLADVRAGLEKTYDISGSAGHPHSVTLTAADFDAIAQDGMRTVQSTTVGGHSHTVTVMS